MANKKEQDEEEQEYNDIGYDEGNGLEIKATCIQNEEKSESIKGLLSIDSKNMKFNKFSMGKEIIIPIKKIVFLEHQVISGKVFMDSLISIVYKQNNKFKLSVFIISYFSDLKFQKFRVSQDHFKYVDHTVYIRMIKKCGLCNHKLSQLTLDKGLFSSETKLICKKCGWEEGELFSERFVNIKNNK